MNIFIHLFTDFFHRLLLNILKTNITFTINPKIIKMVFTVDKNFIIFLLSNIETFYTLTKMNNFLI